MVAHLNRLVEAILMSTHNIGFYEDLPKIIFEFSLNTHFISSAGYYSLSHLIVHMLIWPLHKTSSL